MIHAEAKEFGPQPLPHSARQMMTPDIDRVAES